MIARTSTQNAVAKAPPPKPNTISMKDIAVKVGGMHGFPVRTMNGILADFITNVTTHLKKGDKVRVTGLGILSVRKRPARMGRNPATGESIKIKASKKVSFRPAKDLKESL